MSILGTRVVRTEDPRLLTLGGTYVDDLRLPELAGAARVTFVRSPVAHALITGIDVAAARTAPGVIAVLTVADLTDLGAPPPDDGSGGSEAAPLPLGGPWAEPLLAADRVRYVGEAVAIVITDDRYQGEDAAELVSVDYEPLPAVVGADAALAGADAAVPRGRVQHPRRRGGAPADASIFDGCDVVVAADHREPAARAGADGRARRRGPVGRRQADRLGEYPERADLPVHPGRSARA